MIAFKIWVNGTLRETIEVSFGAITSTISYCKPVTSNQSGELAETPGHGCMAMGGFNSVSDQSLTWPKIDLALGDRVEIHIVGKDN